MERPTEKPNSRALHESMVDRLPVEQSQIVVLSAGSDKQAYPEFVLKFQHSADPSAGGLVGERVLVHGLVANPESNNRTGTATGWDSERKRYIVQLHRVDGSMVSLKMKPANLRKL
jgi:hypothetical protein